MPMTAGLPREREPRQKPFPIGTVIEPFGKVAAILLLSGERYYHLIDKHGCISMMPDDEGLRSLAAQTLTERAR